MRSRQSDRSVGFVGALGHSLVGKLSVMVFGFGTLMVVARQLSPEDIGVFLLMQSVALFLMEASSFGIHPALAKALAAEEDPARAQRLSGSALAFRLVTVAAAALVAWISVDWLAALFDLDVPDDLRLYIPLLVVVESLLKFLLTVLQGNYRFKQAAFANVLSSGSNASFTLVLLLGFGWGIEALFVGRIAGRVVAIVYGCVATRIGAMRPDMSLLGGLLRFGAVLQANYLLSFVYQRVDTFLIAGFLGPAELAMYEIARRLPDALIDLHEAFVVVYFPFVSGWHSTGDTRRIERLLNIANQWVGLVGGLGALGAFLYGETVLTVLFSARYASAWPVFGLLIIAVMMVAFDSNLGYVLVGVGDAGRSVVVSVVRTVAGVALYLALLPPFGVNGAAATNSLSLAVVIPVLLWFLRRRRDPSEPDGDGRPTPRAWCVPGCVACRRAGCRLAEAGADRPVPGGLPAAPGSSRAPTCARWSSA